MSRASSVRTVDCHVAGAPLRLIVEGLSSLRGDTLAQRQADLRRRYDHVRRGLMCEPRGHADMTGALLTTPASPGADIGLLFMRAGGHTDFSGHGLVGAVTIVLERQLLVTSDPHLPLVVDTAAGPVHVLPTVEPAGERLRVAQVAYRSHPSFTVAGGVQVGTGRCDGLADIVWADGLYALVDGETVGIALVPDRLPMLRHTALAMLERIDVRRFAEPVPAGRPVRLEGLVLLGQAAPGADVRSVTVYADGLVDRSPSGSATAAVMTVLDAMGLVDDNTPMVHESLWGTRFTARVVGRRDDPVRPSLEVEVAGDAWITGEHTFIFEPADPLRASFPEPWNPGSLEP